MSEEYKTRVKSLTGASNWLDYKYAIQCHFKRKQIWKQMMGITPAPVHPGAAVNRGVLRVYEADMEKYELANDTAMDIFVSSVSDDIACHIRGLPTAKDIWDFLINSYEQQSKHWAERTFQEFIDCSMEPSDKVLGYIMRMKQHWQAFLDAAVAEQANFILLD